MSLISFFKDHVKRKQASPARCDSRQLSDFYNEYRKMKITNTYTNFLFSKVLSNALSSQNIDLKKDFPDIIEDALVVLGTYFLKRRLKDWRSNKSYATSSKTSDNSAGESANYKDDKVFFRDYIIEMENEISTAIVIICIDNPQISYLKIMDRLIAAVDILWSFESFEEAVEECEYQEELIAGEDSEFQAYFTIVSNVWISNLQLLICNAQKESFEFLESKSGKYAIGECTWRRYFLEYFYENMKSFSDEVLYDMVQAVFLESAPAILKFSLFDAIFEGCKRPILYIIQQMTYYQMYEPEKAKIFEIDYYYNKILDLLILDDSQDFDNLGNALDLVMELLIKVWKIPKDEVEEYVKSLIRKYMYVDNITTAKYVMHLTKLLSCKFAYDYINDLNPHIALASKVFFHFD